MVLALVILLLAVILLIYNTRESKRVEESNLDIVTEFEKIYEANIEENKSEENNEKVENKTSININGNNYIGVIYIPTLNNLALPVLEKYTDANLKISICKYSGGIEEGNFTIAGHNYKSSFGKLSKLSPRKYYIFQRCKWYCI